MSHFLGIDIGTSAIKAAIWNSETGEGHTATSPSNGELALKASQPGWAEQEPLDWWLHTVQAVQSLPAEARGKVQAIGITYQMHGLVVLDDNLTPVRPSIIWCDSRATLYGAAAMQKLGKDYCFSHLLNSPGNFTAAKLAWVKENEPEIYKQIIWAMLPGDYIAAKLTSKAATTESGLSEMILWDFEEKKLAQPVLEAMSLDIRLYPPIVPTFGSQGLVQSTSANLLGIPEGRRVSYRAGDQPNNAFSLGCLNPGDVAATAGTSGVVYGISDTPVLDPSQRFNTFLHVNNSAANPRFGLLLCINGCGSLYSWLHNKLFGRTLTYPQMNALSAQAPVGSDGLLLYPFGNGAERILGSQNASASLANLDFQRHDQRHICRAAQEGIGFALRYGMEAGIEASTIRAGDANLFQSDVFAQTVANLTKAKVEIWNTDGAIGAARGAAVGFGHFARPEDAFGDMRVARSFEPSAADGEALESAYQAWKSGLPR
ncbi:MAG TPA: FGGY family carbohydrate kinase [Fimbriimonadaceae bacterium]|jgi:xylulokinase